MLWFEILAFLTGILIFGFSIFSVMNYIETEGEELGDFTTFLLGVSISLFMLFMIIGDWSSSGSAKHTYNISKAIVDRNVQVYKDPDDGDIILNEDYGVPYEPDNNDITIAKQYIKKFEEKPENLTGNDWYDNLLLSFTINDEGKPNKGIAIITIISFILMISFSRNNERDHSQFYRLIHSVLISFLFLFVFFWGPGNLTLLKANILWVHVAIGTLVYFAGALIGILLYWTETVRKVLRNNGDTYEIRPTDYMDGLIYVGIFWPFWIYASLCYWIVLLVAIYIIEMINDLMDRITVMETNRYMKRKRDL